MPRSGLKHVAVIGAGPVGLEAAIAVRDAGLRVSIFERGRIAEHMQRWGHVRMFTSFGANSTALGRQTLERNQPSIELPANSDQLTGREHVAQYLDPLATLLAADLHPETAVVAIGRAGLCKEESRAEDAPFRILVRNSKGERYEEADAIIDCSGTYSQPCHFGQDGLPAIGELASRQQISFGLDDILGADRAKYAGKSVLVIGAGTSAATSICHLAELAGKHLEMWTIWLARSSRSQPLPRDPADPLRDRDRLAARANTLATRGEGNIEFHAGSFVESVANLGPDKGFQVVARVNSEQQTWTVDRIIANVGYQPDSSFYRELQIGECPKTLRPKSQEPGYYVLGSKAWGRESGFSLKEGLAQIPKVIAEIRSGR